MKKIGSLALFIIAVIAIGSIIGSHYAPGVWYESLQKPPFTPPNWLFAPVWIILYIMIASVGWRSFMLSHSGVQRGLWCIQMVLNFIWMPVFFGAQQPVTALIILVSLVFFVFLFILKTMDNDKLSAILFVPYLAWIIVATYLNIGVVILN